MQWLKRILGSKRSETATVSTQAGSALTPRLVWFEIQIAPFAYRFAIIPQQPIVIGLEKQAGEKGLTLLIRYDRAPDVFDRTVDRVDELIRASGVMELPPHGLDRVFANPEQLAPGVHLRFAYADNRRWAGHFEPLAVPDPVDRLLRSTQVLAKKLSATGGQPIEGSEALAAIRPENNPPEAAAPKVVLKVHVSRAGEISLNSRTVSMAELGVALDALTREQGAVWYSRENPGNDVPEPIASVIRQVLDAVMERKLPIRLIER